MYNFAMTVPPGYQANDPCMPKERLSTEALVGGLVFLATFIPLWWYIQRFGLFASLSLAAQDSFYYLTIARNSVNTPFFTFDGTHPTNGFHPAWEFLLRTAMRHGVLPPADMEKLLHRFAIGNLLILSTACGLLASAAARQLRRPYLAFLAVCPGFLWFVGGLAVPVSVANWSFENGMETSLELLFLGMALILLPRVVDKQVNANTGFQARLMLSTFFFGLTVLARLDDIFFLLPFLVLVWMQFGAKNRKWSIACITVPLTMVSAYVLYNRITLGIFLPSSGTTKAGFPLGINFATTLHIVVPRSWDSPADASHTHLLFGEVFFRVFQLVAPLLVCSLFLVLRRDAPRIVQALCVGVVLKGLYNFVFVHFFHQGGWYFAASIFTANLVIALEANRRLNLRTTAILAPMTVRTQAQWIAACILFTSFLSNIFINTAAKNGGVLPESLVQGRQRLQGMVRQAGGNSFIELDDGELAFVTGMPALSGFGLALDPEASAAWRNGHFLELALQRNTSLVFTASGYDRAMQGALIELNNGEHPALWGMKAAETDHLTFKLVAVDAETGAALYRIVRR